MGRKSDARIRILDAALVAIWNGGSLAVSVDRICHLAKVNKGSFYHFFESKTDLLLAYIESAWVEVREKVLEPAFAPAFAPIERPLRYIEMLEVQQQALSEIHNVIMGCPFSNLATETTVLDHSVTATLESIRQRHTLYLIHALTEAGSFPESQLEQIACGIHATATGALIQAKLTQNLTPLSSAKATIERILQISG